MLAAYVYAFYARYNESGPNGAPANTFRISRFTHIENGIQSMADPSSEVVLWASNAGYPPSHDGGVPFPVRLV
jgi:hypothetical protein